MDDDELLRYSRQMILPDWGADAQLKLREASVLIVGVGGLGSPAAMYLAAAGTGRLVLIDNDRVELPNLQRQVLFATRDIGALKVEAAKRHLSGINPLVQIDARSQRLDQGNAEKLIEGANVVVDGSDNFETRDVVNRACVATRTPLVTGSVIRWEGQITVVRADDKTAPCYACLFPPEAWDDEPSCADAGIIAPLPGIIGAMQALEAMKLIGQTGEALEGRLLTLDAKTMQWSQRQFEKDPECIVCGDVVQLQERAQARDR